MPSPVLRVCAVFAAGAAILVAVPTMGPLSAGCAPADTSCLPADFGVQAPVSQPVSLAEIEDVACSGNAPRLIAADAELAAAWAGLAARRDGGVGAPPVVDFGASRVALVESPASVGIAWAAVAGESVVFGLRGCLGGTTTPCVVHVVRVDAPVTSATAHTCAAVACGTTGRLPGTT